MSNIQVLLAGAVLAAILGVGAGVASAPTHKPTPPAALGPRIDMHEALHGIPAAADAKVETDAPQQG